MARKVQEIFEHAVGLSGPSRDEYLAHACGNDAALATQVRSLLRAHDEAATFLASPTAAAIGAEAPTLMAGAEHAAVLSEGPGSRIGPYKLLQLIGEGGFGSVFMAEQERPVQRKVAIKIIKLGMDTRHVVARFEQERQALAMMDHPNIAKVLDAGATETGRPFFVMELVKGDPIVDYCDKNSLTIDQRLALLAQVCNAVQHAHTKGIIHRDIKPSNVLVSTQDGRPHAKVIDFGIAKATESKLTEKTLFTEHRQLIGTPEYMSPEQAEGNLDIDTRTDVYSLGVLLYELLTGTTPFTGKELRSAAFGELQRIIREVEPPKPSTRLSSNSDTIASVAAMRHTEPRRLGAIVRGELDWIVMKSLEKDRQRRYETAEGLAMDLRRYLTGEAVLAAPPGAAYRFKKFVRRHRGWVTTGGAVAAALLIGAVGFAWQARVARVQRDLAIKAEQAAAAERAQAEEARIAAVAQEAEAKKQAAIAKAVAKFQTDMLASVDPANMATDPVTGEPLKDTLTVVQVMHAAIAKLDAEGEGDKSFKDQPLAEAAVRSTVGLTLLALGRASEAQPILRKALSIRRGILAEDEIDIAASLDNLAGALQMGTTRVEADEAEELYRKALAIRRAKLPAADPSIGTALNNLGVQLAKLKKQSEAEPIFREAVEILKASSKAEPRDLAAAMDNLAKALIVMKRPQEAEPLMLDALEIRRKVLPAGHPEIGMGLNNLAATYLKQQKFEKAEKLYREALTINRAALPAAHPEITATVINLGFALRRQNKLAEAEPLYRESLERRRAALPAGHPDLATPLNNLGLLLLDRGKLEQAEPLLRESLDIRLKSFPEGHSKIAQGLHNMAGLLVEKNQLDEAEAMYRQALAIRREELADGSPRISNTVGKLAGLLQLRGKFAESEQLAREALAMDREAKATDEEIAASMSTLASAMHGLGKTTEARQTWDEAIALLRKGSPDGSAGLARVLWRSGRARCERKDEWNARDAAAALPELQEAVSMAEKFLSEDDKYLAQYRRTLTQCREAMGK